jgi:hypothetical protein
MMSLPVFILVDADIYGIKIMLTYRFGSAVRPPQTTYSSFDTLHRVAEKLPRGGPVGSTECPLVGCFSLRNIEIRDAAPETVEQRQALDQASTRVSFHGGPDKNITRTERAFGVQQEGVDRRSH